LVLALPAIGLPTPRGAFHAQTQPPPAKKPPAATTASSATKPAPAPDLGWPRTYKTSSGPVVLYQPQIARWDDQTHMVAWSAVSYTRSGATKADLGTIKIEADTSVSTTERLVSFRDFAITESNFSTLDRDQTREVVDALKTGLPESERVIALDRVLAAVNKSAIRPKDATGVKADPPKIFASTKPAILVNIDGEPIWNPIKDVDLEYAVNTNWDLFQYTTNKALFLRNGTSWLTAASLNGPWAPVSNLPGSFDKIPADASFKEVKANVPGKSISDTAMPAVFVSTAPAELLLVKGNPVYEPVPNTSLMWVSNTESDLFRMGKTGAFYYLVSGRWFSSPDITAGPWTFATPSLPADFQKIPLEHPRSRVLASVPGTDQANEAVLLATIPQTARVNTKELKAPDVMYDGDPKFEQIESTPLERAVNTDKDVIKMGDIYYMCFQAVWFMSKSPTGPWEVATNVPKEIYTIPASSPSYHVTYVTVVESAPNDDWVTFAYVAGYTGMMVAWGCAVWGTGWYYPPYVHYGAFPVYYGYGRTYGASAWYNPWTGAYGRGGAVYGPYGGAGAGAVYNPRTGTYARGASAYGPYGSRSAAQAWNPRTGTYGQTRQGSNVYGNWGSSSVQRGDQWARTGHTTNYATGGRTSGVTTASGACAATHTGVAGRTTATRSASGDVYAGHDGNVYRKSSSGSWESWNNGGWSGMQPATRPGSGGQNPGQMDAGQLNRDAAARYNGSESTMRASEFRSSPSIERANSYRGGAPRPVHRGR